MTNGRSGTRNRTAEAAFDDENAAGDWLSNQSALALPAMSFSVVDASESSFYVPLVVDNLSSSRSMAGNTTQPSVQPPALGLHIFASPEERTSENGLPRPLKRRRVDLSSDSTLQLESNNTSEPSISSSILNGPDSHAHPAGYNALWTTGQDALTVGLTTGTQGPSSQALCNDAPPSDTTPVDGLHQPRESIPLLQSPYPEYSDAEWARVSRHPHLVENVNAESDWARQCYARRKERGFQISENYSLREFSRKTSRFAREALLHGDADDKKRAQRVFHAREGGYVGRSQENQLNHWRLRARERWNHDGKVSRWMFFPTVTGQLPRPIEGGCYRENTLLLNFGCWLREHNLWGRVYSSGLRKVKGCWELCRGLDIEAEYRDDIDEIPLALNGEIVDDGLEWEEFDISTVGEEEEEFSDEEVGLLSGEDEEEEERRALT